MIRSFFRFIFRSIFWIFFFIGLSVFTLSAIGYFLFMPSSKKMAHDAVLSITLNGPYVEQADPKGIESLFIGKDGSLYTLTNALYHAAQDKSIKGIIVKLESPLLGTAQIQEVRDALLAFRKAGKPSWCYTDSFGVGSSATGLYYLATACNQIWLQDLGSLNLTGINMEVPFAKEALEKLDLKFEMVHRKEYKSYVEMFTHDDFSEPNREALQAISDSILSQFVEGIAKERQISHDHVRLLISNGPYLTHEALAEKLVDRVDYYHNLMPAVQEKLGKHTPIVGLSKYLDRIREYKKGPKIALIFGSGTILRDGKASLLNEVAIFSNSTYKTFQTAINDKDINAIVYRINSSGGSPIASETIASIIHYAKDHGHKPVIISMSDTAASGAYWIATAGSKIVAQPATLTGSIGVFGGKLTVDGLFEKLGIKWRHLSTSENATMWSMNQSYTPAQWVKLNALLDQIYKGFTSRVAKTRHMTPEQVEKVARGRVWTGEQALALGLVDQLGGLQLALDLARTAGGLSPDAGIQIYPKPKTLFESIASLFEPEEEESFTDSGLLGTALNPFRKIWAVLTMLVSSQEILYAPIGEVKR